MSQPCLHAMFLEELEVCTDHMNLSVLFDIVAHDAVLKPAIKMIRYCALAGFLEVLWEAFSALISSELFLHP